MKLKPVVALVALAMLGLTPLIGTAGAMPTHGAYCFGKAATITFPDHGQGTATRPNQYYATAKRDVIVTTDAIDHVDGVQAGDVVCTRGGNDVVTTGLYIHPTKYWNRIKVDAGSGNDLVEADSNYFDEPRDFAGQYVNLEVHTGPGDDVAIGYYGTKDQFFDDGGYNTYRCAGGADTIYYSSGTKGGNSHGADCEREVLYSGYKAFYEYQSSPATQPAPTTVATQAPQQHYPPSPAV